MNKGAKIVIKYNGNGYDTVYAYKAIDKDMSTYHVKTPDRKTTIEVLSPMKAIINIESDEEKYWEVVDDEFEKLNKVFEIQSLVPAKIECGTFYKVYINDEYAYTGTIPYAIYTDVRRVITEKDCRFEIKVPNHREICILIDIAKNNYDVNFANAMKWVGSINEELQWGILPKYAHMF